MIKNPHEDWLVPVDCMHYDGVVVVVVVHGGLYDGVGDGVGDGEPTWRLSPASRHLLGWEAQNLDPERDPTQPGDDEFSLG